MNANVAWRVPAWRNIVWIGVVASVVAWAWAWLDGRGAEAFMLVIALAAVLFAYKAVAGMRAALIGLMVAGLAMFLGSLYFLVWVFLPEEHATAFDVLSVAVFPMVTSAVVLVGAATGFRHLREG